MITPRTPDPHSPKVVLQSIIESDRDSTRGALTNLRGAKIEQCRSKVLMEAKGIFDLEDLFLGLIGFLYVVGRRYEPAGFTWEDAAEIAEEIQHDIDGNVDLLQTVYGEILSAFARFTKITVPPGYDFFNVPRTKVIIKAVRDVK